MDEDHGREKDTSNERVQQQRLADQERKEPHVPHGNI